jgi:hypothetical protein
MQKISLLPLHRSIQFVWRMRSVSTKLSSCSKVGTSLCCLVAGSAFLVMGSNSGGLK